MAFLGGCASAWPSASSGESPVVCRLGSARAARARTVRCRVAPLASDVDGLTAESSGWQDFAALGIPDDVARRVVALCQFQGGPTPIQRVGVPAVLSGYNCALLAETGSGKTVAYALPVMEMLRRRDEGELDRIVASRRPRKGLAKGAVLGAAPRVVVLAPTAELCGQVLTTFGILSECFVEYVGDGTDGDEIPAYTIRLLSGRSSKKAKKKKPKSGGKVDSEEARVADLERKTLMNAEVVIATPGRLLSDFQAGAIHFGRLEAIVVDEADEFVSQGFKAALSAVMRFATRRALGPNVPRRDVTDVQVLFVAATLSRADWDEGIKEVYPGRIKRVVTPLLHLVSPQIQQRVVEVCSDAERLDAIEKSLRELDTQTLVFTESLDACDAVAAELQRRLSGTSIVTFHGKVGRRTEVLDRFWAGDHQVLVCTDLGARGLDFPNVRHVAQYSLPATPEMYLHRLGRTARAGQVPPFYATTLVDRENDSPEMVDIVQRGVDSGESPQSLVRVARREA